jgi:type II secretory pathway pseudopilin PulG
MRLRGLLVVLVVVASLAAVLSVRATGASFTRASDSTVGVTTATVGGWLNLYSESTDPDGLGSYYDRNGSSPATPAATGRDTTLAVNLGGQGTSGSATLNRVLTIHTPATFPVGTLTQVTVTATRVADPATSFQPIDSAGFATIGSGSRTASVPLGKNVKYQLNVHLQMNGSTSGKQYIPTVVITITYTGFTTAYYQYTVPMKIYAGSGAGPN